MVESSRVASQRHKSISDSDADPVVWISIIWGTLPLFKLCQHAFSQSLKFRVTQGLGDRQSVLQ